jgi:hypothetical protein
MARCGKDRNDSRGRLRGIDAHRPDRLSYTTMLDLQRASA